MNAGVHLLLDCRPGRRPLARLLGWSALEAVPALLSGLLLARAVDAVLHRHELVAATWLSGLLVAATVGAVATRGLYPALAAVVEHVRDLLTARAVEGALAPPAGGTTAPVTQVVEQVDEVRGLLSALLRSLRTTAAPLVAAVVGLALLDLRLAAAVAVPLAAALGVYRAVLPRAAARARSGAVAEEQLGRDVTGIVAALPALRGLGAQEWSAARLERRAAELAAADLAAARVQCARHLVVGLGGFAPLVSVLLMAAALRHDHGLSTGALVGASAYVLTVLTPALSAVVSGAGGWLMQLGVVLDRLALVAGPAAPAAGPAAGAAGELAGAAAAEEALPPEVVLQARHLAFAYRPGARPVLPGLDLTVRRGELVALVGPSGAGKSTTALLLAGLLRPAGGDVRSGDGIRVCLVPQEAYVVTGTLRENLGYLADSPPADAALNEALDRTGLSVPAARLGGLDAMLSGADLSAGERQRLVLARAYLGGAEVVVLDETTSGLDPDAERAVEELLREGGRTLVVVAHRLDVTRRADTVVCFDGRDVRSGTHEDLLGTCPAYRELCSFQAGAALPA